MVPTSIPHRVEGGGGEDTPRTDFVELGRALNARVLMPSGYGGTLGRIETGVRRLGYWGPAWRALRADPSVVVSLSEKIGLCVALLDRSSTPHVVVAHNLTTPRRRAFQARTHWLERTERIVVLSRPQETYLRDEVGIEAHRVHRLHDKVDHRFFTPQGEQEEGYVLSVGLTGRDYPTLIDAVRPTGVPTVIVASSTWISGAGGPQGGVPPNVTFVQGLTHPALRRLYDRASLVVVPLRPGLEWAAGVNAVLEAMAMQKALVVSDTPGIADYVSDGATGVMVPPGDAPALRSAIAALMADRGTAARLGAAGRTLVESGRNLDTYVADLARITSELTA